MAEFFKLLQQAQEMSERLKGMQEELAQKSVTGSAGGGMVTVEADGRGQVRSVRIDPNVINPADVEMLEDLVLAAIGDAQKKAAEVMREEMSKATGGLPLPFNLPL